MLGSRTRRILLGALTSLALLGGQVAIGVSSAVAVDSGNPILPGDHPDPTIKNFAGAYYVYSTTPDRKFHAWKSTDLTNWADQGVVFDTTTVGWATNSDAWAPDMVARNGKYYFYSAVSEQLSVAVCTTPVGPCVDKGSPLVTTTTNLQAIDPMVFVDNNQAYLYFGGEGHNAVVRLNNDMISLSGAVQQNTITYYTEGPFVFKRGSTYYMHYANGYWFNSSYNTNYATATNPMGPWTYRGQILSSTNGFDGPGHDSVLQYPGTDDWYVVYHRYQNGCNVYCTRYAAIQRMYLNADGTIQRITPEGVGVPARPAPGNTIPGGHITGPGGLCVDVAGNDTVANGAAVQLWTCLAAQDQHYVWNGTTLRAMNKCIGPVGGATANGTKLDVWDCNGSGGQAWQQQDSGSIVNTQSGRCIDSPGGATGIGTRLQLWDCNGSAAQKFVVN